MNIDDFLQSLSSDERDFISNLDYQQNPAEHRIALDRVISRGGHIAPEEEIWFPYEVIELGSNHLQEGHSREYAACVIMRLLNVISETDKMTDPETFLNTQGESISSLPDNMGNFISGLTKKIEIRS